MRILLNLQSNNEDSIASQNTTDSQTVTPTFGSLGTTTRVTLACSVKNLKTKAIKKEKDGKVGDPTSKINASRVGLTSAKRLVTFGASHKLTQYPLVDQRAYQSKPVIEKAYLKPMKATS